MRLVLEHHPSMTLSPASQTPSVSPAVKGRGEGAPSSRTFPSKLLSTPPVSLSLSAPFSPTSVHSEINSTSSLDPSHSRTQKHSSLTGRTHWFTPRGMLHGCLVARAPAHGLRCMHMVSGAVRRGGSSSSLTPAVWEPWTGGFNCFEPHLQNGDHDASQLSTMYVGYHGA